MLASLSQEIKATPMLQRPQYMQAAGAVDDGSSAMAMQRSHNYANQATGMDAMNPYMRQAQDAQTETTTSSENEDATGANGGGSDGGSGSNNNLQSEGSIRVPSRLDAIGSGTFNGSGSVYSNPTVNFSDSSSYIGNGPAEKNALTALGMSGEQSQIESPTESMNGPLGAQLVDTLRNSADNSTTTVRQRVRRDDSDDREADADDEDGVWVDDDGDDDNGQQSSDVNETAQDPDSDSADDNQSDNSGDMHQMRPSQQGMVAQPHGYELSPNDLMIYHG